MNHQNFNYDTNNIPYSVGDKYYAQDQGRDFWYQQNVLGEMISSLYGGKNNFIFTGGITTRGTSFSQINISATTGVVNTPITVPLSYATLPAQPTTTTVYIQNVYISIPSQTNFSLANATLDGTTVNYLKLRYSEANVNSRNKALDGTSYYYEVTPSYSIACDSTANNSYEILLATIVGDGATTMSINQEPIFGGLISSTGNETVITAGNPASNVLQISSTGLGVNISPTASITLPSSNGNASTAPIKLTAGTLLGTVEDGTIEYDGTNFYITQAGSRGPIVESGSNSNGSWVKWADGTMECWRDNIAITGTIIAITKRFTDSGNSYFQDLTITFPVTFASTPVNVTPISYGFVAATGGPPGATTTYFTLYAFTGDSAMSGITMGYHAIGKWK